MTNPANAVEFDNVSIVFGPKPAKALPLMDAGQARAEIEAETGQISGCITARLTSNRARSLC